MDYRDVHQYVKRYERDHWDPWKILLNKIIHFSWCDGQVEQRVINVTMNIRYEKEIINREKDDTLILWPHVLWIMDYEDLPGGYWKLMVR